MNTEEDTYSAIFSALKHPLRRRILRMLEAAPSTYTEILNELGIEKGLLNYHLENLRELITKDDDNYILSEFGRAGLALIERVEEPVKRETEEVRGTHRPSFSSLKAIPNLLLILILLSSVLINGFLYLDNANMRKDISEVRLSYDELQAMHRDLLEKYNETQEKLKYALLWYGEPEIADPRFLPPGNVSHAPLGYYRAVASKLNALIEGNWSQRIKEVIVYHYPDWVNGTAYVALSDTSPEVTGYILSLFDPSIQKMIIFIQAPAPLSKLEEWEKALWDCRDELKDKGIKPTGMSTYYNGKILFGIEELKPDTLLLLKEVIKEKVPPGVVALTETGPIIFEGFLMLT